MTLALAFVGIAAFAAAPRVAATFGDVDKGEALQSFGVAYNRGTFVPCHRVVSGSTVTVSILNSDLAVKETVTFRGLPTGDEYSLMGMTLLDDTHDAVNSIYAVKGFFGTDNDWYIVVNYSKSDSDYDEYLVYNSSGTLVCRINSQTYVGDSATLKLYYNTGVEYVALRGGGKLVFLLFKRQDGVQSMKLAQNAVSAYPNPLGKGKELTVTLGSAAVEGTVVAVTDLNGVSVYRKRIEAGATSVSIPSARLRSGNYIYTVISPDSALVSGKLIVE